MAGNALPLVSIMILSGFISVRNWVRASPSWPTRLQQMQPFSNSRTPEMDCSEASWESIAMSPNSFLSKARR